MGLWDRSYTGGPQRAAGGGFGVGAGGGPGGAGRRDPFASLTPWAWAAARAAEVDAVN